MPNRQPNTTITCAECGASKTLYMRPSVPIRFCSKTCSNRWTSKNRKWKPRAGPEHHAWMGDAVSRKGGRARALHAFPATLPCVDCGNPKGERHHIDDNTANNAPDNVVFLCRACHMRHDGRLEKARAQMRALQPAGLKARHSK